MSQPYGQQPTHASPQQGYPPHNGYGGPPPPPRRKKSSAPIVLIVLAVVALVLFGGCAVLVAAVGGSDQKPTIASQENAGAGEQASAKPPKKEKPKPETAGIGDVVKDGKFSFKVTRLERRGQVGGEFLNKDAQGVFLLVHVTVKNVSDEAQAFSGSAQKLFDGKGAEYEASSEAAIYLQDSKSLYEKINPGNSVKGVVLFDIPKTVKPASIELHDSMFSGGIKVRLS
ncbi:DUF4352 domain-containing protein [Nonomuraea sp. NPDC050547]|uniref:DUF4352 domain-containing protein n=1 Tax=Nonomuraea sp. NPDC050547 TaxID=3364368 RepID=UPI00379C95E6